MYPVVSANTLTIPSTSDTALRESRSQATWPLRMLSERLAQMRATCPTDIPRCPEQLLLWLGLGHVDVVLQMVEIFIDRIEITNPGEPLVDTDRFVDSPPRSRNELLASVMRRIGTCEERGSGWDKVVFQSELFQLPAPLAEVVEGSTRVVLFSPRPLGRMDKADRIRSVYLHACLRHVNRESLTNASVRERFGIEKKNSAIASRLIKEAIDVGMIVPFDPDAGSKAMRYLPFWAAPQQR